jgi:hypothetical protein
LQISQVYPKVYTLQIPQSVRDDLGIMQIAQSQDYHWTKAYHH